jgi:cytochrome P450
LLKLQHDSQKENSYRSFAPMEWSEGLGVWCVYDPGLIISVLKSPDFAVVDYAEAYAQLERRTGQDWADLIHALHNIPLANEGERHSELRRDFAKIIRARSDATKLVVEDLVSEIVPAVFRDGRSTELVQELLRPILDALFSELIGVPAPKTNSGGPSASQIFDRFLGLNRRKAVQSEVSRLSKELTENTSEPKISVDYAVAFMILGHDALLGALGSSLLALLREGTGLRLCDLSYPDSLPQTGVPYLERIARTDSAIHGISFRPGDRVRLFLEACPARGHSTDETPFFGKGRHLCLGKELSQWLWRTLTHSLAKVPHRVRVEEARLRSRDFVFSVYESIRVSVYG